jgi:uncharacterized membrane protein YqjE
MLEIFLIIVFVLVVIILSIMALSVMIAYATQSAYDIEKDINDD